MEEIKLNKRYPNSRIEDITDAYMRGWNDALDAVQNGKFHIAEQTEPFFRNPTEEEMRSVHEYIESISTPTGVNIFDLMDEQTEPSQTHEIRTDTHGVRLEQTEPSTDCSWR